MFAHVTVRIRRALYNKLDGTLDGETDPELKGGDIGHWRLSVGRERATIEGNGGVL